jgi:hypothetical protein
MATRPPPYDEFYGKTCPYRLACPHLQGQNVETLWQENQLLREENRQVHQRNEHLVGQLPDSEARCAQLEARHRRQFKANREAQDQSHDTHPPGGPRRRGAPHGHAPWRRPPPRNSLAEREGFRWTPERAGARLRV